MDEDGWQGILIQTLIMAAMAGLRQALSEYKDRNDDPTLPEKGVSAEEAEDLIRQSRLLIERLEQHPGLVKARECEDLKLF